MRVDEQTIERIAAMVAKELSSKRSFLQNNYGMFEDVDKAVEAAYAAQRDLMKMTLQDRKRITDSIVKHCAQYIEELAAMELEETGMGNYEDKLTKMRTALYLTPSVEDFSPGMNADDTGAAIYEYAPFGVIGALTPSTNPPETVVNNSIMMIAAGNSVVFSTHPNAYKTSSRAVVLVTEAIEKAGGPKNLITSIANPTMEKTNQMMTHPKIALLCATGGPGVVKAILSSGKKGIGAGAGNPPVLVDETANIAKAAKDIIAGASYDYNIPCIAEKAVVAVDQICSELIGHMTAHGAYLIKDQNVVDQLTVLCIPTEDSPNKKLIGKSPAYILRQVGVTIPVETRLAIFEAPAGHMLVMNEQMMPLLPIVRVRNADEGIDLCCDIEHGRRHSSVCHSKNTDTLTKMAKQIQTTIFVANGPSFSALGIGGIGPNALTIAGPTGEGPTTPKSFARKRRIMLVDSFNIR